MPAKLSVVDLSDFDERRSTIAEQLLSAASTAGFFYVTNHGLSREEIEAQFQVGNRFFDLPAGDKQPWKFESDLFAGWRSLEDTSKAVGVTSWEQYLVMVGESRRNQSGLWVPESTLPGFRQEALKFAAKANEIAVKLLSCFEEALQLQPGFFAQHLNWRDKDCRTLFGWNHYPDPVEQGLQPNQLRLLPHADTDVITLLFQRPGEAGLEILPGKDADRHASDDPSGKDTYGLNGAWTGGIPQGRWTRMDPIPGAITVNIGNMLMRLSDNLLKSTYHRVRAPLPDETLGARRSMVLFVHGRGSEVMQGKQKVYPAATVAELIASNGRGYEKVK